MSDPFSLVGKTALISGGSRGIGLAVARLLLQQGADVIVSGEIESEVAQAAGELGPRALGIPSDVTNWQGCLDLAADAGKQAGRLDILVCCAGISGTAGPQSATSPNEFDRVMRTNLRGMVALAGAVLPHLAQSGGGSAILIGSIAASRGNAAIGTYALAKAGVVQLARNLAVEWGPRGVRVNSVSPGLVATGFSTPLLDDPAFMARRMQMTPLRRLGRADEIAGAVAFLASDAGGFVTGHDLVVDGGTLITDGN